MVALVLGGCAQTRYQWGGYDESLYQAYKDPSKMETLKTSLESHVMALETSKQKVAPGLYAELGTLYFQSGDKGKAVMLYAKERDTWPESRGLMETMIKNVERRAGTGTGSKQ
jgi:hypothetical protein